MIEDDGETEAMMAGAETTFGSHYFEELGGPKQIFCFVLCGFQRFGKAFIFCTLAPLIVNESLN